MALKMNLWKVHFSIHSILGILSVLIVIVMASFGVASLTLRSKCVKMDWKTPKLVFVTKIHKVMAYFLVFGSQVTISFGIKNYFVYNAEDEIGWILISCSNAFFLIILISAEVIYRMKNKH